MIRQEIEAMMKKNNQKTITLVYNQTDKIGIHCFLQGGVLMDYTTHRVDRKKNIWGYINYFGNGDADMVSFDGAVCIPFMRNRFRV